MSRLRLLFFWLLVLAVPLQGFAATSKLWCGSAGGRHTHAAPHAHVQHHAQAAIDEASELSAEAGEPTGVAAPAVEGAAHQCGLCAACCHAVAIAHEFQPVFASPAPQGAEYVGVARIATRGVSLPEKPPRA